MALTLLLLLTKIFFCRSKRVLQKAHFLIYKDRLINVQPLYLKNISDYNGFWRDHTILRNQILTDVLKGYIYSYNFFTRRVIS